MSEENFQVLMEIVEQLRKLNEKFDALARDVRQMREQTEGTRVWEPCDDD